MSDVFKTIVISAANKAAAEDSIKDIPGAPGTFSVALAKSAAPTVLTNWGGSGYVPEEILTRMWPTDADISDDQPMDMMTRLGLVMWQDPNGI
jgi:hypothetical protein